MRKNKALKVHLIGIAGAGMSALAVMLKEAGYRVSGSDEDVFGPIPKYLRENRISFATRHSPKNVPTDAEFVVVGNHAGLAPAENPETRAAIRLGLPIRSLPETLAMLSAETENIVVAGSFGKSTMTSLLAFCLKQARREPSYFIGAVPVDLPNSSHLGRGREFVLEGDEYTSAWNDPRSKFLHFRPSSVVLISAEHDHVNKFPTEASYVAPYKKLAAKIPANGYLVYALRGKNNAKISRRANCAHLRYDVDDKKADWYAKNMKYGHITSFDLMRKGKKVITIKTKLLGRHNIENIVGAAALLLEQKKMSPAVFARAVGKFRGIQRRIELKNPRGKIPVYDIFGSSLEKARAGFEALRLHFPNRRMVAVFEPHAFSWRNKKFLHWYKNIFQAEPVRENSVRVGSRLRQERRNFPAPAQRNIVDEVIMLPAVSRGKNAPGQLSTEDIWAEAGKHFPVHTARTEKEALAILRKIVKKGDIIALVSSGPMLGLTKSVPKLF